ncbi:UvrABC system protein A [Sporomusa ovata DSM 2662]|uniref:UvrABC system protein A n=1 Tax=Sporomusa ovata TaxID=2378 RepID=A0A0U1KSK1_9FIRM|nr:excinuclease ABC subunit UvrA [Sporomusa ovata]EQB26315.1 UvrABC system protein A [Sporomusa ovata DSM 2662]CQR70391.1 Excinuclease ABC subunit A [Sporomusa ovata]
MPDSIIVKGARQHNLKNIDITIPRDQLVVITGLSGSGKSSLAFDTIYAEGQRRYVESLSAYARQFLGQMDKPDVDYIEGLSPAISIDQKTTSRNPRSTVGTVTEIYDYLRLLFARAGRPYCPKCGKPISQQTVEQMVDQLMALGEGARLSVMAPVVRGKKGEHQKVLEDIRKNGYVRVRVDGEIHDITDEIKLEKNKKHTIEVIVDRIVVRDGIGSRLADSLETSLKLGSGIVSVDVGGAKELMFSQNFACVDCGISLPEIAPRLFSFNSPFGACPDCTGLGNNLEIDPALVIPDSSKAFIDGVIAPLSKNTNSYFMCQLEAVLEQYGHTIYDTWEKITDDLKEIILNGAGLDKKFTFHYENMYGEKKTYHSNFEGVLPLLARRHRESTSDWAREEIEEYMSSKPCPTCKGARLKPEALAVKIGGKNINEVTRMTVAESQEFFSSLTLSERETVIARQILKEINARLGFLLNVGLEYLTLDRAAGTLSGGEAQRIRLATQIGSGLVGVLYILDEPSIGLHQRDNNRLLATLKHMRDLGNTLLVVEHDEDTMYAADHIIDVGPAAGEGGGTIVAQGTVEEIKACEASITGQYLSGRQAIPVPAIRRQTNGKWLEVIGAKENNLKKLTARFPLGVFTAVTGVSGSGKSTLVNEILYKGLASQLYRGSRTRPGAHDGIRGLEYIDKIIDIDQSPIGRTPRSNPATYTSLFDNIREVYSQTPEAKMRGYKPGRFSFNVKGGRCEACKGDGIIKIEMHFLPDVYVPCEVCKGARYNRETLEVHYKGKSIADVLNMVVDEAVEFFQNIPKIHRKLQVLQDVGLGYIKLGQPATQLSGGEAQRIKLATELARRSTGKTLYILDEPTTGLHTADIHRLLEVLQRLVDGGDTVVVIEHNLDVIKTADYIIDLGPEGGNKGGTIVAKGTPEQVVAVSQSYTGQYLAPILARGPRQ